MSRNFYILGATLMTLSLVSCGLAWTRVAHAPGSPGDVALWRTIGSVLLLLALLAAVVGTLTAMFEQSNRRNQEQARHQRRGGRQHD